MTKKMVFIILLGFVFVAMVTAKTNAEIFNSWIGSHYTKTFGRFSGKPAQTANTITYDSSWTETKSYYSGSYRTHSARGGVSGELGGLEH
jgi:hypothetical protein